MIGLGGQEILLLVCLGTVPALAVVIALAVARRNRRTRDPFDDDFDDQ